MRSARDFCRRCFVRVLPLLVVACSAQRSSSELDGGRLERADAALPHDPDGSASLGPARADSGTSATPAELIDDEPPLNPFAADSPWPMAHRNSYCQASSPFEAPSSASDMLVDTTGGTVGAVNVIFSNPDASGHRVAWTSTVSDIVKLDLTADGLTVIDKVARESSSGGSISGAYALMDIEGVFFAPKGATLFAYTDAVKGELRSEIALRDRFDLPRSALSADDDAVVGLTLTYDGYLAFATAHGTVGVIRRDFTDLHVLTLGAGEDVSNSIAADELGGIYVVTSAHMHRVQWTGTELTLDPAQRAWTARYETGPEDQATGRLGSGSGTTPTLMGKAGQDTFVAIADGDTLMHIVLFWRDDMPADFQPIAPGKDPRIAAEVPITFGDPQRTKSVTEQSLLVRGYGALVVNNDYGALPDLPGEGEVALTNAPMYAPFGVEKFEWDPRVRKLRSVWANPDVSCPNGIPAMSSATSLAYCVGQRSTVWTFEALDWQSGASVFSLQLGVLPRYNSAYGAAEIGPGGMLYSGGLEGPYRMRSR